MLHSNVTETLGRYFQMSLQHCGDDNFSSGMLAETVMVAVNAIYFKGAWKRPFHPKGTKKAPFYISAGKTVQVDMMAMIDQDGVIQKADLKSLSSVAVKIPYKV